MGNDKVFLDPILYFFCLLQIPCCMAKPSKSFFNVLRKSKKSFEKAAMAILRIIEQLI